jgi:hypothetical protein
VIVEDRDVAREAPLDGRHDLWNPSEDIPEAAAVAGNDRVLTVEHGGRFEDGIIDRPEIAGGCVLDVAIFECPLCQSECCDATRFDGGVLPVVDVELPEPVDGPGACYVVSGRHYRKGDDIRASAPRVRCRFVEKMAFFIDPVNHDENWF